jgi:hypothetical protein
MLFRNNWVASLLQKWSKMERSEAYRQAAKVLPRREH